MAQEKSRIAWPLALGSCLKTSGPERVLVIRDDCLRVLPADIARVSADPSGRHSGERNVGSLVRTTSRYK